MTPSAFIGVMPTPSFPMLSASSWRYQSAKRTSFWLYGIITFMILPFFANRYWIVAIWKGRFVSKSLLRKMSRISFAAAMRRRMSMSIRAAGKSPTGVSTENRPPTLGGMSNVGVRSLLAISLSLPFSGSVINTKLLLFALKYSYWDIVSGVVPDFVMTMKSVFL